MLTVNGTATASKPNSARIIRKRIELLPFGCATERSPCSDLTIGDFIPEHAMEGI
jgi:hypothetical protein